MRTTALAIVSLIVCSSCEQQPQPSSAPDREIAYALLNSAIVAGRGGDILGFMADTATAVWGPVQVQGVDAIAKEWQRVVATAQITNVARRSVRMYMQANVLRDSGTIAFRIPDATRPNTARDTVLKYVTHWARYSKPDRWLIVSDSIVPEPR